MDAARSLSFNQFFLSGAHTQATRQFQAQDAAVRTEIARKASAAGVSGGTVTTDFTYGVGPDGQLYVKSGQVSTSRKVSARELTGARDQGQSRAVNDNPAQQAIAAPLRKASFGDFLPPQIALGPLDLALLQESRDNPSASAELRLIDASVRGHERQHFFAAGGLVSGTPVYDYVKGPDGQYYAVGGHVDVGTTPTFDPEKASRDAAALARAATAPADTSAQDVHAARGAHSSAASHYLQANRLGEAGALDMVA